LFYAHRWSQKYALMCNFANSLGLPLGSFLEFMLVFVLNLGYDQIVVKDEPIFLATCVSQIQIQSFCYFNEELIAKSGPDRFYSTDNTKSICQM
jgi:hypothetical protein